MIDGVFAAAALLSAVNAQAPMNTEPLRKRIPTDPELKNAIALTL